MVDIVTVIHRAYSGEIETLNLETGDIVDYRTTAQGIELEVMEDVYKRQDLPFSGKGRIVDLDTTLEIKRGIKGLIHKLLDIFLVIPGSAQTHLNLRRIQVCLLYTSRCV